MPKHLVKFVPKSLDTTHAGKEIQIKKGAEVFDIGTKRSIAPKYAFNTETKIKILGTTKRGSGEYEKIDYVGVLPATLAGGKEKLLQIPSGSATLQ